MKKKVFIGFVGLSRTFKNTSKKIFDNIIDNNSDNYDFDIMINTDFEYMNFSKLGIDNNIDNNKYYDKISLDSDLKSVYNKNGQLNDIIYYNHNIINGKRIEIFSLRIKQLLERINNKEYDLYIFLRMDIVINKKINLNHYLNKFTTINGDFCRDGYFHNRDYNFLWISDLKSLHLWLYPWCLFFKDYYDNEYDIFYKDKKYIDCWNKFEKIVDKQEYTNEEFENISKKGNLSGDYFIDNYGYYKGPLNINNGLFKCVNNLFVNDCIFEIGDNNDIYSSIVR